MDVTYYSPANKATNLFSVGSDPAADIRNCQARVKANAQVNLAQSLGYNSSVRGIDTPDIGYPSSSGGLTLTYLSSRTQIWLSELAQERAVTLPSGTNHVDGDIFTFVIAAAAVGAGKLTFSNGSELAAAAAGKIQIMWSADQAAWVTLP